MRAGVEVFRVGALIVWRGQVVPVVNRWVHSDGTVYLVQTRGKDNGLVGEQVTFGKLVSEMDHFARWSLGDKVEIGPWDKHIKARWWSTRRGDVIYRVNDFLDEGRTSLVITQADLVKRVEAYQARSA